MNRIIQIIVIALVTMHAAYAQNVYVKKFIGFGKTGAGFVNGDSTVAKINNPFGITTDKDGNIYIAENGNNCIRMITPQGVVSTFAGTGVAGFQDGPAASAKFNAPTGLCVDDAGNVYVSDFQNHRIRKITKSTMMVSTVSGSGVAGYKDSFNKDSVQFNYPRGVCMDSKGNLYVGDSWNHRIRIVWGDGSSDTYAGSGNIFGVQSVSDFRDGSRDSAHFYTPCEVKIDSNDNIYVADAYNHRIRKIVLNGGVITVCGSGPSGSTNGGFKDGVADSARLNTPTALYVSPDGGLIYVGDGANNRVRKIENNIVNSIAGTGVAGFTDGFSNQAQFEFPRGIAVSPTNNNLLYVVDNKNNAVRKIYLDYQPIGVNDINGNELSYSLFPNPGKGSFNLKLPNGLGSVNVRIINTIGTQLLSQTILSSTETTINTGLPAGMYLIELTGKDFKTTQKLIVE